MLCNAIRVLSKCHMSGYWRVLECHWNVNIMFTEFIEIVRILALQFEFHWVSRKLYLDSFVIMYL